MNQRQENGPRAVVSSSQPVLVRHSFSLAHCFRIQQTRSWFRCRAEAPFREVGAGTESTKTENPDQLRERTVVL